MTKCLKGFPLSHATGDHVLCALLRERDAAFPAKPGSKGRPYLRYFRNKPIGECPTRREIFNRYKR